jgi:hypothetical protein
MTMPGARPEAGPRIGRLPGPFAYDRVLAARLGLVAGTPIPDGLAGLPWPVLRRLEALLPLLRVRPRLFGLGKRREYAFDGRRDAVEDVPLAERIDARHYASGLLIVRLHTKSAWSSQTAKAQVLVFNTSRAREEPGTLFALATESAKIEIVFGDSAPKLFVAALSTPIAAELRVLLRWRQGTDESAGGAPERLSLGVSLLLRP